MLQLGSNVTNNPSEIVRLGSIDMKMFFDFCSHLKRISCETYQHIKDVCGSLEVMDVRPGE